MVGILGPSTTQADTGLASIYPHGGPLRLAHSGARTARLMHPSVQENPVVHLIFWGPHWAQDTTGIVAAEQTLFRELSGSSYNAILGQYGVNNDVRLAGSFFDSKTPPVSRRLTLADLAREADRVRRLTHSRARGDAQWVILPQSGTNMSNFRNECGEHELLTVKTRTKRHKGPSKQQTYNVLLIAPFQDPSYGKWCIYDYSADDGQRPENLVAATTSLTSHEYAEAATDPAPPIGPAQGWSVPGADGTEIADLCAWYSDTPSGMTVNVTYLWSNALGDPVNGCVI